MIKRQEEGQRIYARATKSAENDSVLQETISRLQTDGIPFGAMYILPDGTVLDLSILKNGHADLWAYLDERIPIISYPQYDIANYLRDLGWIKANTKEKYIQTQRMPTESQMEIIAKILKLYPISFKINL